MNDTQNTQHSEQSDNPRLVELLQRILDLHDSEFDCDSCGEQLDCLAELVAVGHDPRKLLPAVMAHLECCSDCREEFEALVCILRAERAGQC
jgi:hypothetical protein